VPLSAPARQLLAGIPQAGEYAFPGRSGGYRVEIKGNWQVIRKAARLEGVRVHDLRHSYASILASAGLSLPVIGALFSHTQAQTTARYAHLFDDLLRAATERVGAIVSPTAGGGEVVALKGRT
jgi:integrase